MSVNPKTLVEKLIEDSKGRKRLAQATSALAVAAVLITVGVLTFPAISISGSDENLREQGIDINVNYSGEEQEQVAPPSGEAPIVALDQATEAQGTEQASDTAAPITEETNFGEVATSGDTVASEGTDAPVATEAAEGEAVVEGEAQAQAEAEVETPAIPELTEEQLAAQAEAEAAKQAAEAEAAAQLTYSEAAAAALATADLGSNRLIVGTNDQAIAQDANLVASFDNVYLLQYANIEEATKGFLTYFDTAEYVTPDVALAVADEEDTTDPQEYVINTENVYTEEKNPFAELETALNEETTAEADAAAADVQVALIALIDTGAAVEGNVVEAVSMLGADATDENGHGQRMVSYITEENEAAQILSIKALGADGKGDASAVIAAMNYAMERGANIINLSASAYASEENAALAEAVKRAEEAGIVVVGAAGNNGFNAKFYIPGNIEEATIVGAADEQGQRIKQSNFGETVDYNVFAGSTSEAAARMTGFVSVYGEAGIAEVLNQGKIFTTDYVAPVAEEETEEEATEGEGEGEEEAEEVPDEANQDTAFTSQDTTAKGQVSEILKSDDTYKYENLSNQSSQLPNDLAWSKGRKIIDGSTAKVATWDALAEVINDTSISTIILDTSAFLGDKAAQQAKALAAYSTIEVRHSVTIKAGDMSTIYHDGQPKDDMTSYFKVTNGATLTLDGVTLSGNAAYTAHAVIKPQIGRVALEPNAQDSSKMEIKLYDSANKEHYLDALSTNNGQGKLVSDIDSVMAVVPGTVDTPAVSGEPFMIREKKLKDGKIRFLGFKGGKFVWKEVAPDDVASALLKVTGTIPYEDEDGNQVEQEIKEPDTNYLWEIVELPAPVLYNEAGGAIIIHDGYFDKAAWRTNPPTLQIPAGGFRVQTTDTSYMSDSTSKAYFVEVEKDCTLTLKGATIKDATLGLGQSSIYSNGGTVEVLSRTDNNVEYGTEICNNKTSNSVYNDFKHNNAHENDCSSKVDNPSSAGAINMDGGTLRIEGNGITIHGNRGGTTNTAGAIRISGTQAVVKGDVKIYDNRARKNDKFTVGADGYEITPWEKGGKVDSTQLINGWYNRSFGKYGVAVTVRELGFYKDPVEHTIIAWKSAGAILAENGAKLSLGTKTETNNIPQIYGNTGEAGAIRIADSATVVDQWNATIGGNPQKPNYGTNGGATLVDAGTYNMHTGEMSWNSAWARGGAVATVNDGKFNLGDEDKFGPGAANNELEAPVIAHNVASGWGGGIYVESNNVKLYYGDIYDNVTTGMGGGVYVQGDTKATTWELKIPTIEGETHHYVWNNQAVKRVNGQSAGIGGNANNGGGGDGGGLWFCNFGSYLYEELYLEIFGNTAEQNGDDFSKQGASDGQGMGADFIPVSKTNEVHVWEFDYEEGNKSSKDGATLYPKTVFPTNEYMSLVNTWSTTQLPDAKHAVLIHDNTANVGGGIGANGIISFRPLPTYFKVITANLALDKFWSDGGKNGNGYNVKIGVRLLDAEGNEKEAYSVTLDGERAGWDYSDDSKMGKITWDKWHATIDLPIYTFNIDDLLVKQLVKKGEYKTEADALAAIRTKDNDTILALVDDAQSSITTPSEKEHPDAIDYGKAKDGSEFAISDVNEYLANVAFEGWQIEITETIRKGETVVQGAPYSLSMDTLKFQKVDPTAYYSSRYVDTGHNFIVYTDKYNLSTSLTNWNSSVKINKVDQDGKPLTGAGFTLYKADGAEVATQPKDQNKSTFEFGALTPGSYYLVEDAPEGYDGVDKIPFTIDSERTITQRGLANVSVDSEGYLCLGNQRLYYGDYTGNDNGKLSFTAGENSSLIKVKFLEEKNGVKAYMLELESKPGFYLQGRLNLGPQKWDHTRVRNHDNIGNKDYYKWYFDTTNGIATLKSFQNYHLYYDGTEGLLLPASDDASFFVSGTYVDFDKNSATFTVPNKRILAKLTVYKTDASGKLIPQETGDESGAEMALYGSTSDGSIDENNLVATWNTKDTNPFVIDTLVPGTYWVREINPPAGYSGSGDQKVVLTAESSKREVPNNTQVVYPATSYSYSLSVAGKVVYCLDRNTLLSSGGGVATVAHQELLMSNDESTITGWGTSKGLVKASDIAAKRNQLMAAVWLGYGNDKGNLRKEFESIAQEYGTQFTDADFQRLTQDVIWKIMNDQEPGSNDNTWADYNAHMHASYSRYFSLMWSQVQSISASGIFAAGFDVCIFWSEGKQPVIDTDLIAPPQASVTFVNKKTVTTQVEVEKEWLPENAAIPEDMELTFTLYSTHDKEAADEGAVEGATRVDAITLKPNDGKNWKHVFTNLPTNDANGALWYFVKEEICEKYAAEYTATDSSPALEAVETVEVEGTSITNWANVKNFQDGQEYILYNTVKSTLQDEEGEVAYALKHLRTSMSDPTPKDLGMEQVALGVFEAASASTKWKAEKSSYGGFYLKNVASGRYLNVTGLHPKVALGLVDKRDLGKYSTFNLSNDGTKLIGSAIKVGIGAVPVSITLSSTSAGISTDASGGPVYAYGKSLATLDGGTCVTKWKVKFTNTKLQDAAVSVLKVDTAGKPVKGARLQIQYRDGTPVQDIQGETYTWTTDTVARAFTKLPVGKYQVVELSAPAGYSTISDPVLFEVRKMLWSSTQAVADSDRYKVTLSGVPITIEVGDVENLAYCIDRDNTYFTEGNSVVRDSVKINDDIDAVSEKSSGNITELNRQYIKNALWIGYPSNAAGLMEKYFARRTTDEFYKLTQAVIWHYTNGDTLLNDTYKPNGEQWTEWYKNIFTYRNSEAFNEMIQLVEGGNFNAPDDFNVSIFATSDSSSNNPMGPANQPIIETYNGKPIVKVPVKNEKELGSVKVTKKWEENDGSSITNNDSRLPKTLTITLKRKEGFTYETAKDDTTFNNPESDTDRQARTRVIEKPTTNTAWTCSFNNLEMVNYETGTPYFYYIEEQYDTDSGFVLKETPVRVVEKYSDSVVDLANTTLPSGVSAADVKVENAVEITITNKAKVYNFELLKVDYKYMEYLSKNGLVNSTINGAANQPNAEAAIATITTDVTKKLSNKAILQGAVFSLEAQDEGSTYSAEKTSDAYGRIRFEGLKPGNYKLAEVSAPAEFHTVSAYKIWQVKVEPNGKITVTSSGENAPIILGIDDHGLVVIGNEADTYDLPATGGMGTTVFVVAGVLLMVLAAVLCVRRTSRKEA